MDKHSINFINRLTKEADGIGLDAQGWGSSGDPGGGWEEELGPITPKHDAMISYGFGDQVLAIFEGKHPNGENYYIVGVGEALRPYESLYSGSDPNIAVMQFRNKARQMIDNIKDQRMADGDDI